MRCPAVASLHPNLRAGTVCAMLALAALALGHKLMHLLPPHSRLRASCEDGLSQLRGGDLLLHSNSTPKDDFVRFLYSCTCSHVSMVVEDTAGAKFVWESVRRGAQLTPLRQLLLRRFPRRPGEGLLCRRLNRPLGRRAASRLVRFVLSRLGQPYGHTYWKALHNRWFPHLPVPIRADRVPYHQRYCTDLVAETLEHMGVLDYTYSGLTHAATLPCDFTAARQRLPLAPGYCYSSEIMLLER